MSLNRQNTLYSLGKAALSNPQPLHALPHHEHNIDRYTSLIIIFSQVDFINLDFF